MSEERPKINIGYRVGKLTVEERTEQKRGSYSVWRCRCDCGNEILLDTRYLQRGTITDCGCSSVVGPGQRDITGMRFGKLIAEKPVGKDKNGLIWHCKCDCGGEVDAPLRQLNAGYRKSCGCLSRPPLEDLTGLRCHMLTVTGYAGKLDNRAHYWNCQCDCGNTTVVRQDYLKNGKRKSCGCIKETTIYENMKFIEGTSVRTLESVRDKLRSNNTSGYTGVYQTKKTGKWNAQITFQGKVYTLGVFDTRKEAIKARMKGEEMHENFLEWYYSEHPEEKQKKK